MKKISVLILENAFKIILKKKKTGAPYGSTPVIFIDFVGSLD